MRLPSARTIRFIRNQVMREVAALQQESPGLTFEDAIDVLQAREDGKRHPLDPRPPLVTEE